METTTSSLHFIVSTDRRKPDTKARKYIRSHVMKGKNKGKSRRTKYADPKLSSPERTPSEQDEGVSVGNVTHGHGGIPKRVGSELALFPLADNIDSSLVAPVFRYSPMAKKILFPLERCVVFDDRSRQSWRDPLCCDALYLNAMVFMFQVYLDLAAGRSIEIPQPSPAYQYFPKTLRLLRERLSSDDDLIKLSDPTVMVVLTLASHAHRLGQYEAARSHLEGIRKIVDLRGGISNFRGSNKLLMEMFRCDIGMALHDGRDTMFFNDSAKEPYIHYLDKLSSFLPSEYRLDDDTRMHGQALKVTCPRLAKAWDMTQTFCSLINYAAETLRKVPQETLLNTMAAVMYRLVHMRFPNGSLDEAVRLGLSAFCSHIFLRWSNIRLPLHHLSSAYGSCLSNQNTSHRIPTRVRLWLLMVGSMTVLTAKEDIWLKPWLRSTIDTCGARSWSEVQTILKSFQWIDFINDEQGLTVYESVYTGHSHSQDTTRTLSAYCTSTMSSVKGQ